MIICMISKKDNSCFNWKSGLTMSKVHHIYSAVDAVNRNFKRIELSNDDGNFFDRDLYKVEKIDTEKDMPIDLAEAIRNYKPDER